MAWSELNNHSCLASEGKSNHFDCLFIRALTNDGQSWCCSIHETMLFIKIYRSKEGTLFLSMPSKNKIDHIIEIKNCLHLFTAFYRTQPSRKLIFLISKNKKVISTYHILSTLLFIINWSYKKAHYTARTMNRIIKRF